MCTAAKYKTELLCSAHILNLLDWRLRKPTSNLLFLQSGVEQRSGICLSALIFYELSCPSRRCDYELISHQLTLEKCSKVETMLQLLSVNLCKCVFHFWRMVDSVR